MKNKLKSLIPHEYKVQDGCHNCKHCFKTFPCDMGTEFYCELNSKNRPPCPYNKEDKHLFSINITDKLYKLLEKWYHWGHAHIVDKCGICPQYQKEENE